MKFYVMHHYTFARSADPARIATALARSKKSALEEIVRCGINLSEVDLHGSSLRGAHFESAAFCGADLRNADLRGAYLCACDLQDSDLRDARFDSADLTDGDLRGAKIEGASFSGACLQGRFVIDAGEDRRGYRFFGVRQRDGYRIRAGCHWFTPMEAKEHWGAAHGDDPEVRAECLAKITMIAKVACARGW